jgi:hypothetical protein
MIGQCEGAAFDGTLQCRRELLCGDFDDRAAFGADGVVVGIVGQPVGGDAAFDGQGVQDALANQSGHAPFLVR